MCCLIKLIVDANPEGKGSQHIRCFGDKFKCIDYEVALSMRSNTIKFELVGGVDRCGRWRSTIFSSPGPCEVNSLKQKPFETGYNYCSSL